MSVFVVIFKFALAHWIKAVTLVVKPFHVVRIKRHGTSVTRCPNRRQHRQPQNVKSLVAKCQTECGWASVLPRFLVFAMRSFSKSKGSRLRASVTHESEQASRLTAFLRGFGPGLFGFVAARFLCSAWRSWIVDLGTLSRSPISESNR